MNYMLLKDCADTNKGLTDKYGDGCKAYINFPSLCGNHDGNEGFVANQMCCACGGGKQIGKSLLRPTTHISSPLHYSLYFSI